MFQIRVHDVIQRAHIWKIHFHKLCESALNFIFLPWKNRDTGVTSFQFLCCNWVKQKSSLFKRHSEAENQNGQEHGINKMEVQDQEKHPAVLWGRTCWEKEGLWRKNISKWGRVYLAFSFTSLHIGYRSLASRLHGPWPRLEQGRMSKWLLNLAILATILESSLGSPSRFKRQNIPYT